jgi:hypothetical protein
MIENDAQLEQSKQALESVERALRALRARVEPEDPSLFAAMAEDYWVNIRRLRAEIDEYIGVGLAELSSAPLWMVLEGESVSRKDISSRLLSEWLEKLRKSLYGVTSYITTGQVRTGGRPDATILAATDPRVIAVAPGSIRVGLRLPSSPVQANIFEESGEPAQFVALEKILEVAEWAAGGSMEPPQLAASDPDGLTVAARFAMELAPSERSAVTSVSFSGPLAQRHVPLRLTAQSRERIDGLVKLLTHLSEEEVIGQIREIDLELRERGPGQPDLKCMLPEELVSRAEALLDRFVIVRGTISSARPDTMNVQTIDEAPRA